MTPSSTSRYSATVDLQLIIGNRVIEVAQTGPKSIIFRNPESLQSGAAKLVVIVDGKSRVYPVFIATGPGEGPLRQVAYF
jgi:hypothetical protein